MAKYTFIQRPRKTNSNEPLTYDIAPNAGTLVKQKNKWRLRWLGTAADFDTKRQLAKHLQVLGHQVEGLL